MKQQSFGKSKLTNLELEMYLYRFWVSYRYYGTVCANTNKGYPLFMHAHDSFDYFFVLTAVNFVTVTHVLEEYDRRWLDRPLVPQFSQCLTSPTLIITFKPSLCFCVAVAASWQLDISSRQHHWAAEVLRNALLCYSPSSH